MQRRGDDHPPPGRGRHSYDHPSGKPRSSHTHPTDHLYYGLHQDEASGQIGPAEVRAPGDGQITAIDVSTKTVAGVESFDYSLRIDLCPGRALKFGHVSQLSPALLDALAESDPPACREYGDSTEQYEYCSYFTDLSVSSGDVIGARRGAGRDQCRPRSLDVRLQPPPQRPDQR